MDKNGSKMDGETKALVWVICVCVGGFFLLVLAQIISEAVTSNGCG